MRIVTTASFVYRCKRGWLSRLMMALVLLWSVTTVVRAETPVTLTELRAERASDGLYLSAQLRFDLSQAVEEALYKGIPVYFIAEADIVRERWYWSDAQVASARRYMRVSYQPLTRRWRFASSSEPLSNAGLGVNFGQYYDQLSDAMAAVQRISQWKIAEASDLDADARQTLRFRFRLDSSQLPRTFQLGALGQSDWHISIERRIDLTQETGK